MATRRKKTDDGTAKASPRRKGLEGGGGAVAPRTEEPKPVKRKAAPKAAKPKEKDAPVVEAPRVEIEPAAVREHRVDQIAPVVTEVEESGVERRSVATEVDESPGGGH